MSIIYTPPINVSIPTIVIPKHMTGICPFCDCSKEVRYERFDEETGKVSQETMEIHSYQNLIQNNNAQPKLRELCKPVECYCPQCLISFSVAKCVGIW